MCGVWFFRRVFKPFNLIVVKDCLVRTHTPYLCTLVDSVLSTIDATNQ